MELTPARYYLIATTAGATTSLIVLYIARAGLQLLARGDRMDCAPLETRRITRR